MHALALALGAALSAPSTGGGGSPTLSDLGLSAAIYTAGDAAGTVIGTLAGRTSGSSLSLTDEHTGAVALEGGVLVVGASAPAAPGDFEVTVRETLVGATNSPHDTVLTITCSATPESLKDLGLAGNSYASGAAPGTVIGALSNRTPGSSLSLVDDAGGAVALSGSDLVIGASAPTVAGDFDVTVRETLTGAVNSPHDSVLNVTCEAAPSAWTPNDAASFGVQQLFRGKVGPSTSVDGDPVTTWTDQSAPGGRDAAASGGDRPTYRTSGFLGGPAVQFSNSRMLLTTATPVMNRSCPSGTTGSLQVVPDGADPTLGDPELIVSCNVGAEHLLTVSWSTANWALRYNGAQIASAGSWIEPPTAAGTYWFVGKMNSAGGGGTGRVMDINGLTGQMLLGDRAAGGRAGDMIIAEVGLATGQATTDDLERLEGWMAWENNAVDLLPSDHPYKLAAP